MGVHSAGEVCCLRLPCFMLFLICIKCIFVLHLIVIIATVDARLRPQCQQIRSYLWATRDAKEENETNAYRFQPEISRHRSRWWQVFHFWAILMWCAFRVVCGLIEKERERSYFKFLINVRLSVEVLTKLMKKKFWSDMQGVAITWRLLHPL